MDATTSEDNHTFELRVEQQPQRARVCGLRGKGYITPPPCVRLVDKRIDTDKEVDVTEIDVALFVLQVELWDAEADREANVNQTPPSAPTQSISTAVPMSVLSPQTSASVEIGSPGRFDGMMPAGMDSHYMPQTLPNVMYTRNLIGNAAVNALPLKDLEGNLGYWFVLPDLSVRTAGWYRLRMSVVEIGVQRQHGGDTGLNRSRCPIVSSIVSEKFQIYSNRTFPGMMEPTPLSKCFAQQGVSIPRAKKSADD